MEEAITALLLADPRIASLIGDQLHWGELPQKDANPDAFAILQLVSGLPDYVSSGPSGLEQSRLQIDGYAKTALMAKSISNAVAQLLEKHRGGAGQVQINGGFIAGRRDMQTSLAAGSIRLFRRSTDIILWHSS